MQKKIIVNSFISTVDHDWQDPLELFTNESYKITIFLEGRGECEDEQKTSVLEAGDISIIPARTPHRFGALSDIRFGVIHITHPDVRTTKLLNELTEGNKEPRVISLSSMYRHQFEQLFHQWLRVMSHPLKNRELNCEVWMATILLFLLEHGQSGRKILSIAGTADHIQKHLDYPLSISELSTSVGLSVEGYRTMFKQMYGVTPKQYQQQCRMIEAKLLLNISDKGMQEIAERIGFSRLHSFSSWFKSIEGISPTDWRKQQKHTLN